MTALGYQREGAGPSLVLVHGYLGGSAMWAGQIAAFRDTHDVIAPDLPGFGRSADITAPDRIEDFSRCVLEHLDTLGVERFALLGHSMGGMVVQQMAVDAPDRVSQLVCYGTGPVGILPGRFETIDESRARLHRDGVATTARRIAATWFRDGEAAADYPLCEELGAMVSLDSALACLTAWQHWDGRAALSDIACETLVLWGDGDRSYDWSQPQALWQGIADSRLAVVPGCAHNVHHEKPALFNAILGDFLR